MKYLAVFSFFIIIHTLASNPISATILQCCNPSFQADKQTQAAIKIKMCFFYVFSQNSKHFSTQKHPTQSGKKEGKKAHVLDFMHLFFSTVFKSKWIVFDAQFAFKAVSFFFFFVCYTDRRSGRHACYAVFYDILYTHTYINQLHLNQRRKLYLPQCKYV